MHSDVQKSSTASRSLIFFITKVLLQTQCNNYNLSSVELQSNRRVGEKYVPGRLLNGFFIIRVYNMTNNYRSITAYYEAHNRPICPCPPRNISIGNLGAFIFISTNRNVYRKTSRGRDTRILPRLTVLFKIKKKSQRFRRVAVFGYTRAVCIYLRI